MKFSLIIPVYNTEKYLKRLIESILSQTFQSYEIIFVDDGSTDNSYSLLKHYSDLNNKIKVYKKENGGPGLARKFGFEKSNGELLFFVDSDDWLPNSNVLEEINNIFKKNSIDILLFDRNVYINELDCYTIYPFYKKNLKSGYYSIEFLNNLKIRGGLQSKIFKRENIKLEFFCSGFVYEDMYMTYSYLNYCNNFYYINKVFYNLDRSIDNHSLSKKKSIQKELQTLDRISDIYKLLTKNSLKKSISILAAEKYLLFFKKIITLKYSKKNYLLLKNKLFSILKILKNEKQVVNKENFIFIRRIILKLSILVFTRGE